LSPLLALLLLVLAARLGGELAIRANQSPMLGEILAGLLLGPTLFGVVEVTEPIELLSHLGILFLMFLAGLETDLRLIKKVAGPSLLISIIGATISFGLGYFVGILFGLSHVASLFLGGALSTSSIVVTARVLGDAGMMRSEIGLISMATNAVDDVLSMFVVLLLVSVVGEAGAGEARPLWLTLVLFVVYTVLATGVGLYVFRPMMRWVGRLRSDEMYFSTAVVLVLLFSWSAEAFGLEDVLGAFIAGAFLHYTEEAEPSMVTRVEAISDGFLVPIFFASMGLATDLTELTGAWGLLGVALLAAIVGKMVGCGGAARLAKYSWRDSYIIGAGMVPRAEMTLVLLGIGMGAGVLPGVMPPLLISLVFLSALVTSPLLRLGVKGAEHPNEPAPGREAVR
jgi:Kef-type K+ transport system membrane component KefB